MVLAAGLGDPAQLDSTVDLGLGNLALLPHSQQSVIHNFYPP